MDADQKRMYKLMANVISAAGHEIRLAILNYLSDGEQCVCDIADHVEANRSNVSRHLSVMLNAGLVGQRKDGLKMIYSIKTPCLLNFLSCVSNVVKEKIKSEAAVLENL